MKFRKINVHPLRGADPRLRAVANILTTDGYAINGIRVYEDKGKMYVRFPIVHWFRARNTCILWKSYARSGWRTI